MPVTEETRRVWSAGQHTTPTNIGETQIMRLLSLVSLRDM